MKTKYTPGPWKYDGAGYGNIRQVKESGENICNFCRCFSNKQFQEKEANGLLIAAAPELLDVVRLMKGYLEETQGHVVAFHGAVGQAILDKAREVIAKVETR